MIDLHTHSLLSDGALLPSELVRRAYAIGYKAIGIADHADISNIDFIVPRIVKASRILTSSKIKVVPGIELTHVPPKDFPSLIKYARANGIKLVIVHGETIVEPVIPGTNACALECDIDILAHPGLITLRDAKVAVRREICLELTAKTGHSLTNGHVARVAREAKAKLILNTDAHGPKDLITRDTAMSIILGSGLTEAQAHAVFKNSSQLLKKF
ncbi:MAG: histidinol phosphate phosphatase domain-containing protein [Candidatus Omnitrophota bacterium]|nr:histidinol phosphate phosphatase domain-containing protein [Candidatus Omnitrophota bacterium]